MKRVLFGAFIVALCLSTLLAKTVQKDDADDTKEKKRKKCVDSENEHRRRYAKEKNIGNMVKLEYAKEVEEKEPMEGFQCPTNLKLEGEKFDDEYWAITLASERSAESVLATKIACVDTRQCGIIVVVNRTPNWNTGKPGKPGSACSGKADDGLCIGSAASDQFLLVLATILSISYSYMSF